jgi:hypothetical protein
MRVFRILPPVAFTLEKLFAKNLPKIWASPSRRTIFRAFFVAAGANRKTIELPPPRRRPLTLGAGCGITFVKL